MALAVSAAAAAQEAGAALRQRYAFVPPDEAELVVALGGDGFMLHTLRKMLALGRATPVYGLNRGTMGFLMNGWRAEELPERIQKARAFAVSPLEMTAHTAAGETVKHHAINEVSLLRELRQMARIEIAVDGRIVLPELTCDGVLVATPAGSTAYNFSAQGPILPLNANIVALTPISPFRPRRWRGALILDNRTIGFRILEGARRPVSAVADQQEVRDVSMVEVRLDRTREMTLLFDPEHALDDRIAREQFAV